LLSSGHHRIIKILHVRGNVLWTSIRPRLYLPQYYGSKEQKKNEQRKQTLTELEKLPNKYRNAIVRHIPVNKQTSSLQHTKLVKTRNIIHRLN